MTLPTRPSALALALLAAASVGCSSGGTGGGLFGFGGATHRLTPDAKAFREATPPVGPRELAKVLHPPFVVEPGDVLLVQPVEFDSPVRLAADQPVLPDGTIDLGRFGRPVVAGKILPEIEAEIRPLIVDPETKKPVPVAVRLLNRVSKVYYVLGEVNAPGAFVLSGRETVLDAIVQAGGITRSASENKILLSRPTEPASCRVVLPVCYKNIVQLGDTTTNYQVQAGDRIYVPSKTLLESLCPDKDKRKGCDPCAGPQYPCAGGVCPTPHAVPGLAAPHAGEPFQPSTPVAPPTMPAPRAVPPAAVETSFPRDFPPPNQLGK